jgi:hypothetical protein
MYVSLEKKDVSRVVDAKAGFLAVQATSFGQN